MNGDSAIDRDELTRRISEVLGREPGSTAREILAGLPDEVRSSITRREVNSALYKGAGSTFIRSDEEKPRWRLAVGSSAPSRSARRERVTPPSGRSRQESSDPPRDAPAAAEDAPEVQDIARILFDD